MGSAILEIIEKIGLFPKKIKLIGIEDYYAEIAGSQLFLRNEAGLRVERLVDVTNEWEFY
jgi:hypothetical protein